MYRFSTLSALAAAALLGATGAQKVQRAGVNIAGFDFGMTIDGNFTQSQMQPPLKSQGGPDGIGQMQHFAKDDGLNIFRLPVAWQNLVNYDLGGSLDTNNVGIYDQLVQGCLGTGALCIIDIHNYARWYQGIVGQSGVTTQDLSSLWSQLASKYRSKSNIVFGLMNEPHDLDINEWATTVQACVTAIRQAGATSQIILLPGLDFTAVGGFASVSGPALVGVHNLDGSKTNLVFDVHQYLDSDNSGTHTECTHNGVNSLQELSVWLQSNSRMALLSETGGGNTASCETDVCAELDWMNYHNGVYLGWVAWAAGSFESGVFSGDRYELDLVPEYANGKWTDKPLMSTCVVGKFH
ncbi:hypothetical protein LTR62_000214 [Meristemomyces frigidus]|uniref:Endoglucanase EG-II n=1 Tax=Meristemomyces frigidus TaxID=1508187 RepID=A0AAN7TIN7_9PEZI|nr:hypothetical protein LTR62_000214 [Meristemomyces frigidus]